VSLILALVIFGGGFVVGAGTAVVVAVRRVQHAIHHPEEAPARMTARLKRKLDLTDAQTVRVLAILTERQEAFQAIRREVQPRVLAELEQTRDQIAAALDPPQQAQWRRMYADLRARWLPDPPPAPASAPAGP